MSPGRDLNPRLRLAGTAPNLTRPPGRDLWSIVPRREEAVEVFTEEAESFALQTNDLVVAVLLQVDLEANLKHQHLLAMPKGG